MQTPKQLRKDILNERNELKLADIEAKSQKIQEQLLSMKEIQECQNIFAYVSFRSEVQTLTLIDELLKLGKTVTVPFTHVEARKLDAVKITDRNLDLEPGYCDIPEPNEEMRSSAIALPETIETILLPGSVFDLRGGRFGYGGGFYDRFVSSIPAANRIGLAFDLQIVPEAPLQAHDELLDFVITESRTIIGAR